MNIMLALQTTSSSVPYIFRAQTNIDIAIIVYSPKQGIDRLFFMSSLLLMSELLTLAVHDSGIFSPPEKYIYSIFQQKLFEKKY
jgi:hypothetical protein